MALARTDEDVDGVTGLVSHEPSLDLRTNFFPPVFRLPAEILANIFIHNARDSYTEIYGDPNTTTPSWVKVSYVCRHWRDIALNCHTLWTFIPTTSLRWTQELLARSQKAPLKICTDGPHQVLSIVEQLGNHSQRIQELHLELRGITEECHYEIVSKFLSSPFPCLERLEISSRGLLPEGKSLYPFAGNTPALRTLMLYNYRMSFNSLELSALTTLHLHAVQFLLSQNMIMAEFLGMLRRMPHLVHLYIHDSLPNGTYDFSPSGQFSAAPMINLSRLSKMSIKAPISAVNALLSCVDIKLMTSVELRCVCGPTCDGFTRLASLLAQRINPSCDPTPAVPKFRSLIIRKRPMPMLAFSMSERPPLELHGSDENTRLLVHFFLDFNSARPSTILSYMFRSIPLTSIRSVSFFRPLTPDLDFWRDTLASFPNVRHIKLRGDYDYMPKIASMLSLPSQNCSGDEDGPDDGDQNEIFVPALEELELSRINFSRVGSRSDLDTLCEAISTRKETQCGLTLKKCYMGTPGRLEVLELVGRWENSQFRITRL